MSSMVQIIVRDRLDEDTDIMLLPKVTRESHGLTEMRVAIKFECGDSYIAWLPVFTEWWDA